MMYQIEGRGKPKLQQFFAGTDEKDCAIVTVGNPLRKDDGAAVCLGRLLEHDINNVFITNQAPENFTYKLIQEGYSHILIIDAAEMELPPGSSAILKREDLLEGEIVTHSIPIRFFTSLMERLKREVLILGIQPKDRGFGQTLSSEVKQKVKKLAREIKEMAKEVE